MDECVWIPRGPWLGHARRRREELSGAGLSGEERAGQAGGLGLVRDDRPNEHY